MRWIIGLPVAALVTVLIFLMMSGMIGRPVILDAPHGKVIDSIIPKIDETDPKPDKKERPPQPPADPPEPPDRIYDGGGGGPPQPQPDDPVFTGDSGDLSLDGFTLPETIITFPPQYPEGCKSKGASGVVVVEFDITATGEVVNPKIISSADRCFNREVLKTISKWKFSPDIIDGKPRGRKGVRNAFRFELDE